MKQENINQNFITSLFLKQITTKSDFSVANINFYKKLGFTLPKAEQPLRGLELQKKQKAKNQT